MPQITSWLEILSLVAVIAATPIALIELRSHFTEVREARKQEHLEAARAVYREVDDKFNSFLTLCLDHPRLDCFSIPQDCLQGVPLTTQELQQQRLLYTLLIDVCEVAFVEYHRNDLSSRDVRVSDFYKSQWPGWESYIRKFMKRIAFKTVWTDIADEYDARFRVFMEATDHPA